MNLFILILVTSFFLLLSLIYIKRIYNFWGAKKKYLLVSVPIFLIIIVISFFIFNQLSLPRAMLLMTFCGLLYSVAVIDFKTKTIDSWLFFFLLLISLLNLVGSDWRISLCKAGTAFVVFGLLFFASKVSKGIGFGDVKLLSVTALMLDFDTFFSTVFYALVMSLFSGLVLICVKKGNIKYELPFAPFVFLGFVLTILLGVV